MSRHSIAFVRVIAVLTLVLQITLPVAPVLSPPAAFAAAPPVTSAAAATPPVMSEPAPLPAPTLPPALEPIPSTVPFTLILPVEAKAEAKVEAASFNPHLDLNLNLSLTSGPPWAAPGEVVTFTVTATNLLSTPLPGLVLTATLPDGLVYVVVSAVGFAYASSTWLQSVSGAAMYVGDTGYNALGQVTERRLGSATGVLRQLYTYTAAENFRLVSQQAGTAAPYTDLQNFTYTYADTGNMLTISDAAAYNGTATPVTQTQTFTYDPLARLQTAQATGGGAPYGDYAQQSYGYSNAGNVTSFAGTAFAYQDPDHKHALTHVGGVQQYWYDANGNATRRIHGGQDITLTYDAENRLTGLSGGVTASYVYDGDGNRVKETSGGTTTVYIGNYFEWTGDAATMKSYYYVGGTRIAMRTGTSTGTVNYLLGDHLGSTALTLDSAGNRLATNTELRYYPYGVARYIAGTTPTSFNFTGQRKDAGSGLLFYGARWYDPQVGRFLQPDTIVPQPGDPQSLNRYSYALNNPLRYTDPTGHMQQCPDCGGSATPVVILDPNRVNPDDQRRILFAWYDAHPEYNPANDPVLNGQSRAQPFEPLLTQALLTMEYGLWQMDRGDASGVDKVGAGLVSAVVLLGPGASGGGQVDTPYGPAVQGQSDAALALRKQVEQGATLYRQGRVGVHETEFGQFWAPVNPLSIDQYAEQFGTAGTNQVDWVMGAMIKPGANFVTRNAPAFGNNPGGALEVVTEVGGVIFRFFHLR